MAKFSKLRFASQVVIASVLAIVVYIIVDIIILLTIGFEPSITPYVFAFFGGELMLLAAKRIFVKEFEITKSAKSENTTSTKKIESKG